MSVIERIFELYIEVGGRMPGGQIDCDVGLSIIIFVC